MARVERAGRTRAAGGGTDALRVEQQQKALAFNAFKAEAHIAGQAVHGIAVERAVRNIGKTGDQAVAQRADLFGILVDVRAGFLQRRGHAHDGGDVLRACALAALLRAALNEAREGNALPRVQKPDALRAVELVRGEGEHVDALRLDVNGNMARRLHRIGVEEHASLAADPADLGDRKDRTDLIVGVHDGDKAGILADGVLHLLRRDRTGGADGQKLDREALFFKLFERVQHGVMLKGRRNDVLFALALAERMA